MSSPLLEARGIVGRYGHVEALRGADFTVYDGEIVALIGDNGAGKSTLVKILSGADQRPKARSSSTANRSPSARRTRLATTASRRCIRTSRSPRTSIPPPTCSSVANRHAPARSESSDSSTDARWPDKRAARSYAWTS